MPWATGKDVGRFVSSHIVRRGPEFHDPASPTEARDQPVALACHGGRSHDTVIVWTLSGPARWSWPGRELSSTAASNLVTDGSS